MKRSFAAADDDDDDAPPPFPATFKLYMSLPLLEFIFEWRCFVGCFVRTIPMAVFMEYVSLL